MEWIIKTARYYGQKAIDAGAPPLHQKAYRLRIMPWKPNDSANIADAYSILNALLCWIRKALYAF